MTDRLLRKTLAAALAMAAACASLGPYVPVESLPADEVRPPAEYIIGEGDLLAVRVYGQEALSGQVRVRSDGRITLPFANDQLAAGLTPSMLAQFLQAALKTYVVAPVVAVSLEERHPTMVSVLGNVATPGVYQIAPHDGLLVALAKAGGLTPLASQDLIFVVRPGGERSGGPGPLRIRFTYRALARADGPAGQFELRDTDAVVVE